MRAKDDWYDPHGCQDVSTATDYIAELEAERDTLQGENERLSTRHISLDRRYFNEGLERAAEIASEYNPNGSWGRRIADAIRAEIK